MKKSKSKPTTKEVMDRMAADAQTEKADKKKERRRSDRPKRKPRYRVELMMEASRLATVEAEAKAAFGNDVRIVRKVELATSRADRLMEVSGDVESAATSVEELRDELQEWYDGLPENLQGSSKGEELQEAISNLETIIEELQAVDFSSVSFPSMY